MAARFGMRWWTRGTVRCAGTFLMLAVVQSAAMGEPRVALVVGNARYAGNPLRNPRHDAELMARTLASVGFDVISVLDGGAADMRNAVTAFGRRLQTPDTVALFYYAGHGVQAGGENYLIPVGADIKSMNEVALNALALSDVLKSMARSPARMNIVVLDACRDNPFATASRGLGNGGLAPVVAPAGTIIGYATAPGEIARDGEGENSPYSAALATVIPQSGLTLEDVFRTARRRVLEVTSGRQTPWEHSSLVGEFYFRPKISEPETSSRRLGIDPLSEAKLSELDAWEKIKGSLDPQAFKDHIAHFTDGLFAELAAVKVVKLESMRAQTPWSWIMTGGVDRDGVSLEAAGIYEKAVKLEAQSTSKTDLAAAAQLYGQAAAQGLPPAMFAYARAFDKGRGVARDLKEAARWYGLAAEKDHPAAMAALGTMYEFGEGTRQDLVEALRLYRLSSDAGDPSGQTSLGYLYAQGKGVARNAVEARRLYQLAAAKGHGRALFNLALMDMRGEGAAPNLANAVKLLQTASDKGHAGAALELANLYDEGRGVARDSKRAAAQILAALRYANKDGRHIEIVAHSWSFSTRRQLQRELAQKGLYKGFAHGFFNDATRRALAAAEQT